MAIVFGHENERRDDSDDQPPPLPSEWVLYNSDGSELVCSVTPEIAGAMPQVVRVEWGEERICTELYPKLADAMVRVRALKQEFLAKGFLVGSG